jgi:hypothetical protein
VRRAALSVVLAILAAAGAEPSHAQDAGVLAVRAARRDTITAGSTVTAAFTVTNASGDIVHVTPFVHPPADWPVLMGSTPFAVAPNASNILMVSVVVPARAAAGTYALAVSVGARTSDSVLVRVPARRALEVTLVDKPGFVVSGETYDARFLVRNRGNAGARLRIKARSSLGRAALTDTLVRMASDGTTMVEVSVATPGGMSAATDDVLELSVSQDSVADAHMASARVTVVPEPTRSIEEYLRIPTQVNLRAATSDAVSPFEVYGRGPLWDGGNTDIDFLFRGPTGPFSAFGERDEYRLSVMGEGWRASLGDQVYTLSPLTTGAQPGFGAGVDGRYGAVTAGAHGQRFRRSPVAGQEFGGFVGVGGVGRDPRGFRGQVNVVSREGGVLPGGVASVSAGYGGAPLSVHTELARSTGGRSPGMAHALRLSRTGDLYSIDVGHQSADTAFAGAQRGARQSHLTATSRWFDAVSFALSAGSHRIDLTRSAGAPYLDGLDIGTLGATWLERFTLELSAAARATTIAGTRLRGNQQGVRIRGNQETLLGHLSLEAEVGRARDVFAQRHSYSNIAFSARQPFEGGQLALWTERFSGGSLTRGTQGMLTFGGDATLELAHRFHVTLLGYATRAQVSGAPWQSQADLRVSRTLRSGNHIALRARVIGGGSLSLSQQSVAFLEYGMPLRLPVSRLRTPGRVYGRVVDAVSGRGVPGALVRLGPQVAITDGDGDVAFGGVPGGEHRLSMSQETSFSDAVFVGDPTVRVDSTRAQPTTFRLAIARGAHLDIDVRRFASARTSVAGSPDSLVDAGPLSNATLVLAGERDTLYRTTRANGTASFSDIPPGHWAVSIRGDAPAFHRFDPDRVELTLEPGESRALKFRLLPRKREVQIIGGEQELRNQPSDPRNSTPTPPTPRTRKPDDSRPELQ